jgi:hypothetical protein
VTREQVNIAIAEWMGWRQIRLIDHGLPMGLPPGTPEPTNLMQDIGEDLMCVPNFYANLNDMWEAALRLREVSPLQYVKYTANLTRAMTELNRDMETNYAISAHDASSPLRAEVFLKTIEKWT